MDTINNKNKEISKKLLAWYDKNARDLPWRHTRNPYAIWVSEIMLQQTRVEAVKEYYKKFLSALPTVQELARVDDETLLKLWQGLGYYSRARNLREGAKYIVNELNGKFPTTQKEWLAVKGVGSYTSGAIASIAFEDPAPAVDGNVMRVFSRLTLNPLDIAKPSTKKEFEHMVNNTLPNSRVGDYNQSLMELGAVVCLPNGAPKCEVCPLKELCLAYLQGKTDKYPVKSAKKPRKVEQKTVFVVVKDKKVLLHKRQNKGLLAGLWEFVNVNKHIKTESEVKMILQQMGIVPQSIQTLPNQTHIFTHIEWHMKAYLVVVNELDLQQNWVLATKEQLKDTYSVPSAFQKYEKQVMRLL